MGAALVDYYTRAKAAGGLQAQIKLAIITKLPSSKAAAAEDSPENLRLFRQAMTEIGL